MSASRLFRTLGLSLLVGGCVGVSSHAAGHSGVAPNLLSRDEAMRRIAADRDPYWLSARAEVTRSQSSIFVQDREEKRHGERLTKIVHGNPASPEIALTFDDGPHRAYTLRLLEVLRREHVPATFFLVGFQAEAQPDLVRAIEANGHEIGNHTYHHVSLPKIDVVSSADEIKACGKVIQRITGRPPHLFRPPGGQYTPDVQQVAEALGYTTVLWTADPGDYASPGTQTILDRTLHCTRNGGILLLHDGIDQTIDVLPTLIETLRAKGFRFVTVDDLIRHQAKPVPNTPQR
jgi:peptidoglycan/xylan/chitin deacetylase (PgdA/CDA1 family)